MNEKLSEAIARLERSYVVGIACMRDDVRMVLGVLSAAPDSEWINHPQTIEAKAQWDAVAHALGANGDCPDAVLAAARRLGAQPDAGSGGDALAEAAHFAADVLSELYAKYSTKIGPFASQAQMANVKLGIALRALAARQPVGVEPVAEALRELLAERDYRTDGDVLKLADRCRHLSRSDRDLIAMRGKLIDELTRQNGAAPAAVPVDVPADVLGAISALAHMVLLDNPHVARMHVKVIDAWLNATHPQPASAKDDSRDARFMRDALNAYPGVAKDGDA